ncbi:amidohydrolase [Niabella ginsenosidivorans]|uniref:Amidohydrolase n=2 Tax=Niabella ginsenosidivorans TaxID=1176587 RepID=A0A1A9IBF3_9BACT|nr:amidohydrolase [Niabella ginsenosidivorans]
MTTISPKNQIKIKPTQLFDGYRITEEDVLILTQEGTVEAVVHQSEAGDDIKKVDGLLSPGFINCHCHLELSHMQGMIPEHTGLLQFVNQVVRQRDAPADEIAAAIEKAEAAMIKNGIVAVGDICNTADTLFQKEKNNLYYHNFIEVIGFEPGLADEAFKTYKMVYDGYQKVFPPQQLSLTPHAPYSVSTPLWKLLAQFPGNHLLSIHNQETPDENEWFINGGGGFKALYERLQLKQSPIAPTGKTSIQTYADYLQKEQQLLLIHNTCTDAEDVRYIQDRFPLVFWCLCPNANYYISNRLPDIPMMLEQNAQLVLGTDSLASNYGLSIRGEMQRIQQHFPQITVEQMLPWATLNGARALQIDDLYGSFEKGKRPGAVLISGDTVMLLSKSNV